MSLWAVLYAVYGTCVNVICNPHSDRISRRGKESYINFVGSVRVVTCCNCKIMSLAFGQVLYTAPVLNFGVVRVPVNAQCDARSLCQCWNGSSRLNGCDHCTLKWRNGSTEMVWGFLVSLGVWEFGPLVCNIRDALEHLPIPHNSWGMWKRGRQSALVY